MKRLAKSLLRVPKSMLEAAFGIRIIKKLPHGLDFLNDIRNLPWSREPSVILDVGANVGQSAIPLSLEYPNAIVHCFEPSLRNFGDLLTATLGNPKIICHQIGVSDTKATMTLVLADDATMHHISTTPHEKGRHEIIHTVTLDEFCHEHKLAKNVDILKIDTEGHDLSVLRGATTLFQAQTIGVVYCEVSMNTSNTFHVQFDRVNEFMKAHGYVLLGVYEQVTENIHRKPYLRRANVAFVSPKIANTTI
jgi:FkbM family methyltransferase